MSLNRTIEVRFLAPRWKDPALWVLLKPYTSANEEVIVPKGYVTDGASVPYFARRLFPPTGEYFGAAIVHDYCLTRHVSMRPGDEPNRVVWKEANYQFQKELEALNVKPWRRAVLLTAVRLYGWLKSR